MQRTKWWVLSLTALVVTGCDSDSTGPGLEEPEPVGIVDDGGGEVETDDGAVKLSFPPGSVDAETPITAEPAEDTPEDDGVVPGTTYDFGPDGITFDEPVTIVLRYDPTQLPPGVEETSLALHKAETDGWHRVGESVVDTEANTVTGKLSSFSVYGLASVGAPDAVEVAAGDAQSAAVGHAVLEDPAVLVLNQRGDPLADVDVTFAVTAGGGTVETASAVTDGDGRASPGAWTLGVEGAQSLTATVAGLDPVVLSANAVAPCDYAAPYAVGGTVASTLGGPDCVDGTGRFAEYYVLDASEPLEVTLTMESTEIEPVIGVYREDGTQVVAQYASSRGFTRALLAPGSYRIGARSLHPDSAGAYSMTVQETTHTVASCDVANNVYVTPGVSHAGTITSANCVDEFSTDPELRWAGYPIRLDAGTTYTFALNTSSFGELSLWSPVGEHLEISGISEAGTVEIVYTPDTSGYHGLYVLGHAGLEYDVSFQQNATTVDACDVTLPFDVGPEYSGNLSGASCVGSDGRYVEYHELVVEEELSATLTLSSGDFDPFVSVYGSDGRQVVTQYVDSPGFTRALLAPGTYRVAARSLGDTIPGWYGLNASEDAHQVEGCSTATNVYVTPGTSIGGLVSETDCLDEVSPESGNRWDVYPIRLQAGETLTVTLSSPGYAEVSAWNANGEWLSIDGTDGGADAQVTVTADIDGWYTFYALAQAGTEYSMSFSTLH